MFAPPEQTTEFCRRGQAPAAHVRANGQRGRPFTPCSSLRGHYVRSMSTDTSLSVDEFQAEARGFLDANATLKQAAGPFVWGHGSDKVAMFEERDRDTEGALLKQASAWRAKRFDAGLGWITGPVEHGGRGLTAAHQRAYDSLEGQYEIPNQSFFVIGLGMVAPTILAHGSETAKQRYLTAMYRGDTVACQLFSEPGAGSDLASLQTKAERDGDDEPG